MFKTIVDNLIMVAWFLLPLVFCRTADIIFGSVIAYKSETITFDFKVIIKSIVKTLLILIGLACLVSGVVMLPELIKKYGNDMINTDILKEFITIVTIISTLAIAAVSYGKDAFLKFKSLIIKSE